MLLIYKELLNLPQGLQISFSRRSTGKHPSIGIGERSVIFRYKGAIPSGRYVAPFCPEMSKNAETRSFTI